MKYELIILVAYIAYLVVFSLVAFAMYGKDKKMSKGGTEVRIKEKTLLFLAVFGGGVGAMLGRIFFHHKTNKIYFSITIILSVIMQVALLVLALMNVGGVL